MTAKLTVSQLNEIKAEVIRLRSALRQFAQCSAVRDIVSGDTELALAVFAARAALANDKE